MRKTNNPGIAFPQIPERWNDDSRHFAMGLRDLFEQTHWQKAYPVGIVVLSVNEKKPFAFGEWEEITTGITGVNGWKRVK